MQQLTLIAGCRPPITIIVKQTRLKHTIYIYCEHLQLHGIYVACII